MITSVKVGSVDETISGLGGRTLSVRLSSKPSFETPTRPFSAVEFGAKQYLGFRGTLDGNLGAIQLDLRGQRLQKFLGTNDSVISARRRLTSMADLSCCFENFAILDVPGQPVQDLSRIKLFLEMQRGVKTLNYVSMPPLQTNNPSVMEKTIAYSLGIVEGIGKGVIPQLTLADDVRFFKDKLKMLSSLAETGSIQIINLVYADPDTHPHQYLELWKNRDIPAILNCSSVPRSKKEVSPGIIETPSITLQRYGIDTITPLTKTANPAWIIQQMNKPHPSSFDQVNDYSWACHPGGAILTSKLWRSLPAHNVECNCKVCNGRSQSQILSNHCYNDLGLVDDSAIRKASQLHDAVSSQLEYVKMNRRIKSHEMAEYIHDIEDFRNVNLTS